jgi:hypothetical protein
MAFFALCWATLLGVTVYAQSMGCVFIHCYFTRGAISMAKSALHSCAMNLMIEFYIAKFGLHHDVITSTGYGGKYKQQESNFKFLHRVLLLELNLFYLNIPYKYISQMLI